MNEERKEKQRKCILEGGMMDTAQLNSEGCKAVLPLKIDLHQQNLKLLRRDKTVPWTVTW